jgi:DNA topoisomerase-1
MRLRMALFQINPKAKKKHPELAELESDMDDEFMERHEVELTEKAMEGAKKKFEKDNIKLEEQKEPKMSKADLDARLKEIKAEFKEMVKERKSGKVEPKKGGE